MWLLAELSRANSSTCREISSPPRARRFGLPSLPAAPSRCRSRFKNSWKRPLRGSLTDGWGRPGRSNVRPPGHSATSPLRVRDADLIPCITVRTLLDVRQMPVSMYRAELSKVSHHIRLGLYSARRPSGTTGPTNSAGNQILRSPSVGMGLGPDFVVVPDFGLRCSPGLASIFGPRPKNMDCPKAFWTLSNCKNPSTFPLCGRLELEGFRVVSDLPLTRHYAISTLLLAARP